MSSFDSMNVGRDHLSYGTSCPPAYSKWPKSSVEDYLRNEGVSITEVLEATCTSCEYRFDEALLRGRLANGATDVVCPSCETRNRINPGAEKTRASHPAVGDELFALKTTIAERRQRSVDDIKRAFQPIEVFYSYAHADEALRDELA